MALKRTSLLIHGEKLKPSVSLDDLVMTWAVDIATKAPRYILELDADHSGGKCNCSCPSCNLSLIAVNAGKSEWKRRPHFRHPEGAAREECRIIAARKAIEAMLGRQERIVLPRRYRTGKVEGLSGTYYDAWVERPAESVGVAQCDFIDEANALLILDDGRRLHVRLVGRGEMIKDPKGEDHLTACIEIQADDPAVAGMAPEEILARLQLVWDEGCWVTHWADGELNAEADAFAKEKATDALDWIGAGDLPDDLSPAERRETLLHREVKAILERERRIRVPELTVEALWQRANDFIDRRSWSSPDVELRLSSVELEVHLGRSVPDVVVTWVEKDGWSRSMLIEVTVTNPITDERIERLSSFGWPALEIDISRMGGSVTREEFTRLVVDEVAGKRWLYHPGLDEERASLILAMQQEEVHAVEMERQQQALLDVPAAEWAKRYLDAFRRRWQEQQLFSEGHPDTEAWRQAQADVSEAIRGLAAHGYPASLLDEHPLRTMIARILSLHDGIGIEYRTDIWGVINAILSDGARARKWHTLYLIAAKIYPPDLPGDLQEKVEAWRRDVVESIRKAEEAYVRETTYDRLLGLMFPEISPALNEPFGTSSYPPKDARGKGDLSKHNQGQERNRQPIVVPGYKPKESGDAVSVFTIFDPFECHPWAQQAEMKPLLEAASAAAKRGVSPGNFALGFVRPSELFDKDKTLQLLIEGGFAKTRYEWSWEWDRNWICRWK